MSVRLSHHPYGAQAWEVGASASLIHQSLKRQEERGHIKRDDVRGYPLTWSIVHPPSDDRLTVDVSARDAYAIVHLLRWLVDNGHCGEPTEQLIARVEGALDGR